MSRARSLQAALAGLCSRTSLLLLLFAAPPLWGVASSLDRLAEAKAAGRVGASALVAVSNGGSARVLAVFRLADPEREDAVIRQAARLTRSLPPTTVSVERSFELVPALALTVTAEGLAALLDDPDVLRVDLDAGGGAALAEAVPLIGATAMHGSGLSGAGSVVAVLDSGLDPTHPDLVDSLDGEACFCSGGGGCCPGGLATRSGPGSAVDDNGHGTHVAGIVTANGSVSAPGVAPAAKVVMVKVLDAEGSFCCSSDIVAALDWIGTHRPDVDAVNLSLGTSALFAGACDSATAYTRAMSAAVATLRTKGIVVVASSGNNRSKSQMAAPACIADVVSVGAVYDAEVGSQAVMCADEDPDAAASPTTVTCFTNDNATLDLVAPGAPITSTRLGGGTITAYGTSMAAPMVAGCAALIRQAKPAAPASSVATALRFSPFHANDARNGLSFPRLDCPTALAHAALDTSPCVRSASTACLLGGRFEVKVTWRTATQSGTANVMSFGGQRAETDQSVFMWFFNATNFEMGIKMVDACVPPFNKFWAFVSGLTNQAFYVTIRDTRTGEVKPYDNPLNVLPQTIGDTAAFPCP